MAFAFFFFFQHVPWLISVIAKTNAKVCANAIANANAAAFRKF